MGASYLFLEALEEISFTKIIVSYKDIGISIFVFSIVAIVEVKTKDGNTYSERVDLPKGHLKNPMTDGEIEAKYRNCVYVHL